MYTSNGTFVTAWGNLGFGPGSFTTTGPVAIDSSGNVYVTYIGSGDNGVQKFTVMAILLSSGDVLVLEMDNLAVQ
jgi:hypothetical protein